jgi:hypothetical protein
VKKWVVIQFGLGIDGGDDDHHHHHHNNNHHHQQHHPTLKQTAVASFGNNPNTSPKLP